MVTTKQWEAYDLKLKMLKISRMVVEGISAVHFEQRYDYTNEDGTILQEVPGKRFVDDIAVSDIPSNILASLSVVDTWMYNKCLEKEGMK